MPSAPDVLLEDELGRLVSRLRSIGSPRLAGRPVATFATRGDAMAHLVREMVVAADEQHGFPPRLADMLLGDQLAVVGADALRALRTPQSADKVLFLLGEVVLHRFDLDGTLPKGQAGLVLGGEDLVTRLRVRCPAR